MKKPTAFHFFLWQFCNNKEKLIPLLIHEDRRTRQKAERVLDMIDYSWAGRKNMPAWIPVFTNALGHHDPEIRVGAAEVLGMIGNRDATGALISALNDHDAEVRAAVAWSLGVIGDKRASDALAAAMADGKKKVRAAAAGALGNAGDGNAVDALVKALKTDCRSEAAKSLGQMGDARATAPLVAMLKTEKSVYVRKDVVEALGAIGDKRAEQALLNALDDVDNDIKVAAITSLGAIGSSRAASPVLAILKESVSKWTWFDANLIPDAMLPENPLNPDLNEFGIAEAAARTLGKIGNFKSMKMLLDLKKKSFHGLIASSLGEAAKSGLNQMAANPVFEYFPDMLCRKCRRRPKRVDIRPEITGPKKSIVYCPACGRFRNWIVGVKEVIGIIGGDLAELHISGKIVGVPLWDENNKSSKYADIDLLLIQGDGVGNYAHAINAVILELSSDASRPPNWSKTIPVRLEGNPDLSEADRHLLRDNFDCEFE